MSIHCSLLCVAFTVYASKSVVAHLVTQTECCPLAEETITLHRTRLSMKASSDELVKSMALKTMIIWLTEVVPSDHHCMLHHWNMNK